MRKLSIVVLAVLVSTFWVVPVATAATPRVKAFCKAALDVERTLGAVGDEGPTAPQGKAIDRALTLVEEKAPAKITSEVATIASVFRASAQSGSDPFEDPELGAAIAVADEFRFDRCGYEQIETTALEYEFEGFPRRVDRGIVAIRFTNEGAELHELAIFRYKGDEKIKDLLELGEEEAQGRIVEVGGTFAAQNQTSYAIVDLNKTGRYGAACFIPVGSTSEAAAEAAQGPPHAVEGMAVDFRVRK